MNLQNYKGEVVTLVLFTISVCCIFLFDTTGNSSDSVAHFCFSKYAFNYPANFLNHWAKPLFTTLSAPFCQFGFTGMKLFNILLGSIAAYFTYRIAQLNGKPKAWLVIIFCFFSPMYFAKMYSGLTEYLFAAILAFSLYLVRKDKWLWGCFLISFLPLSRSEGLVVLVPFAVFLLVNRKLVLVPMLFAGQVLFNLAGAFYYNDLLWVFTKIPYSYSSDVYGSGEWFHFLKRIPFVTGIPIYVFLCLGLLFFLWKSIRNIKIYVAQDKQQLFEVYCVYGMYASFFVAHTIFWWFGIFGSFGLLRVFNAIIPLIALIALDALIYIATLIRFRYSNFIFVTAMLLVIIFPFLKNPHSLRFEKDLSYAKKERCAKEEIPLALSEIVNENSQVQFPRDLFMTGIHLYYWLNFDPFPWGSANLPSFMAKYEKKLIDRPVYLVWDAWHDPLESKIPLEKLTSIPGMEIIKEFKDLSSGKTHYIILKYITE